MNEIAKLSLPGDMSNIKHTDAFLSSLMDDFGFSSRDKLRMCVALEEALHTIFKHLSKSNEDTPTEVSFFKGSDTFEISLLNTGAPYLLEENEYGDISALVDDEDALSSYVMRKTADNIIYRNMGRNGQEIRLIKYLEALPDYSGEALPEEEIPAQPPKIQIRPIKPEEVIEISRCVYDEYKYTYPNEDIYYPERVVGMIQEKRLFSSVSVTENGEIAGHAALKFCPEYPKLMDTAIWVVKKKFRGFFIMKTLLPYSLDLAKELDINGVFVEAVTHHGATQKVTKRYGFCATAFYLLHTSGDTKVNYDTDGGRRSLAIGYKAYADIDLVRLYIPKVHNEHLTEMYRRIGTTLQALPLPENYELTEKSELTVEQSMWCMAAFVDIDVCGKDLASVLKNEVKRMKQTGMQVVMIRVNMDTEYCPYIYECALSCGFFYTGFVPHSGNGNLMLMENLMGNAVNYENTVAIDDYAEVLNYIRKFDPNEF